ncbi:hypothetical protein LTR37_004418 [Vermiconidia calcicola]|uniref:Uncharacterized protein n=1 Tax=Vermiconidia calcicola TaxID=1690605 RepID=A0ACC3NMV2_9PEZI|nr:hypothetical protein LTR37_004418 [Vermiconidia calcicola]
MCNGESSRTAAGGCIAILHSPATSTGTSLSRELSIRIVGNNAGVTTAAIDGFDDGNGQVIIHRDGDLRSGVMTDQSILHRIMIPKALEPGAGFSLQTKLDLGVGGDGIIGRKVSLLDGHVVLAEGIVGWN